LYGEAVELPETSRQLLDAIFATEEYETLYQRIRNNELESKELLLEFDRLYPNTLKGENIDSVISSGRQKRREAFLAELEEKKSAEQ